MGGLDMNDYDEQQIKTLVWHTQQMLNFLAIIAIAGCASFIAMCAVLMTLVMS